MAAAASSAAAVTAPTLAPAGSATIATIITAAAAAARAVELDPVEEKRAWCILHCTGTGLGYSSTFYIGGTSREVHFGHGATHKDFFGFNRDRLITPLHCKLFIGLDTEHNAVVKLQDTSAFGTRLNGELLCARESRATDIGVLAISRPLVRGDVITLQTSVGVAAYTVLKAIVVARNRGRRGQSA